MLLHNMFFGGGHVGERISGGKFCFRFGGKFPGKIRKWESAKSKKPKVDDDVMSPTTSTL